MLRNGACPPRCAHLVSLQPTSLQLIVLAFFPLPRLPAGMLLVVGGCWAGMPPEANRTTDLLATVTDSADDMQLFWEVGAGVHAFLLMLLGACHQPWGMNGRAWHGTACTCGGMGMVYHGMAWHGMAHNDMARLAMCHPQLLMA